jgi:hypothetical protein
MNETTLATMTEMQLHMLRSLVSHAERIAEIGTNFAKPIDVEKLRQMFPWMQNCEGESLEVAVNRMAAHSMEILTLCDLLKASPETVEKTPEGWQRK